MTTPATNDKAIDPDNRLLALFWKNMDMKPAMTMAARFYPCWTIFENNAPLVGGEKGVVCVQVNIDNEIKYLDMPQSSEDMGKAEACTRCENQLKCLAAKEAERDLTPRLTI